MFRTVVVPLDGSALSEEALPYAEDLGRRLGASIVVVRAVDPVPIGVEPEIAVLYAQSVDEEERFAAEYVATKVKALQAAGVAARGISQVGEAASVILQAAREADADVIVMATHGRSGLSRWAFGSVADRVLRASVAPVLLVRAGQGAKYARQLVTGASTGLP